MNGEDFALKVGKGAAYIFSGTVAGYVISFFYKIILARWLGPEDFGILSLILMVLGFMSLFALGIPSAIVKYISETPSRSSTIIKTALVLVVSVSLLASLALFLLSDTLAFDVFGIDSSVYFKITSLILFTTLVSSVMSSISTGFQRMGQLAVSGVLEKTVKLAVTFALLYFGFGIIGAVAAFGIGVLSSFLYLLYVNRKHFGGSFDGRYIKRFIMFGFPLFVGSLGINILSWTDTTFLGILTDPVLVGLYNAAAPIMWYLSVPISALAVSLFPAFSEISNKRSSLIEHTLNRALKYTVFLLLPAATGVILLSHYVILILYGESFLGAKYVLEILSAGAFFHSLALVLSVYLSGIGRPGLVMKSNLAAAAFNIPVSWYAISYYGLGGAGISTLASTLLMFILLYYNSSRFARIRAGFVWKPVLSTAAMALAVLLVISLDMRAMHKVAISVVMGAVVYFISMASLKSFDKFDKDIFRRVSSKIARKFG